MNELKTIIFDLDDTLYLEKDFILSGFRAVSDWAAENLGIATEKGYQDLANLYHQGVRNNTFDLWLSSYQIKQQDIPAKLIEVYRTHIPDIEPLSDTIGLLRNIVSKYKIGLVSDGYLEVQRRKWSALKLDPFFDAVVFSDQLGRKCWKPSVAPFDLVLEKLNSNPAHSVYIGDNATKDFLGARQIGMYTIQIKRQDAEYGRVEPPTPDHAPHEIIYSLMELMDYLKI
jgi:putative hydrolase of the HAD superfamily